MESVGNPLTVTCSVGSTSTRTAIRFHFNNTSYRDDRNDNGTLYPDVGIFVNCTFNMDDCSVQSSLTILQFSEQFRGQYSCLAYTTTPPLVTGENVTFSLEVKTLEAGDV